MNTNFSNKNKFKITIHNEDGKNLEFLAKSISGLGFQIGTTEVSTQAKVYKIAGDTYASDDLAIDFYLDENWTVYFDLMKWMKKIRDSKTIKSTPMYMQDITVEILDTKYKHNFFIDCRDCFPYSVTTISLDTDDDAVPLMGHVDFACNDYEVNEI